jgi:hypothetical protein
MHFSPVSCFVFFFFNLCGGTLGTAATHSPIVPAPDDRLGWLWRNWWNKDWQRKPKYSEKPCPSSTLSTTSPTFLYQVLNPGRRGGKPATDLLSYGAASVSCYFLIFRSQYCHRHNVFRRSRDSDYLWVWRARGRSSNPGRVKNFLFSTSSRPTLGPT